jgi:hypothetical protein
LCHRAARICHENAAQQRENMIMRKSMALGVLALVLAQGALAATINVPADQPTIPAAFTVAGAGDVINVAAGTYVLPSVVAFNVPNLTLQGAGTATTIQVSGTGDRIQVYAAGATIQDLQIEKTDKTGEQNIIRVAASDFTLQNTEIWGQFVIGDGEVSRAMVFNAGGNSGILITGNTFRDLRQPAYISGTHTGLISNNHTYNTKGWVLEGGNLTFTSNTWGLGVQANVYDVAILSNVGPLYYTDIVAMANANNEAVIEDQRVSPAVLSVVYVDATTSYGSDLGGRYHPYSTITPALARVVGGGTVHVAAGSYIEPGQLAVTKNMTVLGASAATTLVKPGTGTTNGGNVQSEAFIYVASGVTATLQNLGVDCLGQTVHHAVQTRGNLTVMDCAIQNVRHGLYYGRGVVCYKGTSLIKNTTFANIERIGVHVRGNVETPNPVVTVENCTYTGKGSGDWLDYGVEFGGGGGGTVTGCTITNCLGVASTDGSTSAGVLVTDYWGTGTSAAISSSTINGNTTGVAVGYNATDASVCSIHACDLSGNAYGVEDTSPLGTTDATGNWWGDATGPHHATLNPGGLGVEVSDHVLFDPWLSGATIDQRVTADWIALDAPGSPLTTDLTVACLPSATWRGVNVSLSYNEDLLDRTAFTFNFSHPDGPLMYWTSSTSGSFTTIDVSIAIPGVTAGQTTPADLFTITFDGAAAGLATIQLNSALLRNLSNQPITPITLDGVETVTIDGGLPIMTIVEGTGPGHECLNTSHVYYDLSASDDIGLDKVEVQVNGGGWSPVATGIGATTWSLDDYDVAVGTDGLYTVEFRATDGVNYSAIATDQFIRDTMAPDAPAGLDARPAFHACDLYWTAGGGSPTSYTLYWKKRHGVDPDNQYPYPGGLPAAWDGLGAGDGSTTGIALGGTYHFDTANTFATRGVYDFVLAAVDCADNETRSAVASATNYFLGDVAGAGGYDGVVHTDDLNVLAPIYGTTPSTNPEMEMNIGPTDDWSSYGLPATVENTALVNFEDLIIFAMNFGPSGPQLPITAATGTGELALRMQPADEGYHLVLSGQLKGFSARIESSDALLAATADFPVFFYRDGGAWVVDAVSLSGNLVDGSTVALHFAGKTTPVLAAVDGRDARNQPLDVATLGLEALLPTSYALEQNFPNPFNPTTTIRYALPEVADLRLVLFNALGQEVMVLASGSREAGFHEARLDGSGLASGVYVYRLEAGRFMDQKKLVLVK